MTRGGLWRISANTSAESEEAVAALFSDLFSDSPSVFVDADTGRTVVSVYCQRLNKPQAELQRELREGLRRIQSCGLDVGPARIAFRRVRSEDWAESWRRHFKPFSIGSQLLIKPGWSRRLALPGQATVVLDPGLSFGTGQHPTTSFCLRQIVACRPRGVPRAFLDIGTGSGILAIAAAKLGYAPVHALDSDPVAVRVARNNASVNRVQSCMRISNRSLRRLSPHGRTGYDLICANLTADLLLAEISRVLSRLKRDGRLVLAGVLRTQFPSIRKAYAAAGLRLLQTKAEKEWQSGIFAHSMRSS